VAARSRDRAPHADQASADEQHHKADATQTPGGKKNDNKKGDAAKGGGDKGD
jgi:hypothetical protein